MSVSSRRPVLTGASDSESLSNAVHFETRVFLAENVRSSAVENCYPITDPSNKANDHGIL